MRVTVDSLTRWGMTLALAGNSVAMLLAPIRACDSLIAVATPQLNALLRPGTAVAIAWSSALGFWVFASIASTRDRRIVWPGGALLASVALLAAVVLLGFHESADESLAMLDAAERTNEPVIIDSDRMFGLPTPYTMPGNEFFWSAVAELQAVRAIQYGYPTDTSEPFSTMYAEMTQSSLGSGNLLGAEDASDRLVRLTSSSPLALMLAAKVAHASGENERAIVLVREACGPPRGEQGWEGTELDTRLEAATAYYNAAGLATKGQYDAVTEALLKYARLSLDPLCLERATSDPAFHHYAHTEHVGELATKLALLPLVDRNLRDNHEPARE
jgi:hypothetical protein